jgi:hypothetical protein
MLETAIGRPAEDEYSNYYGTYVSKVLESDPIAVMAAQAGITRTLLGGVGESGSGYRYGPDKWSIKEIVGHLCDTERIMAYRALRIARGDETPLPGFEQDDYVRRAESDRRPLIDLIQELADIRHSTLSLFRGLPDEAWSRRGIASGYPFSVRALAFIIPGHERHHVQTLKARYGLK